MKFQNKIINPKSAVGLTLAVMNKIDEIIKGASAVCESGCNLCCHDYFFVREPEFRTILFYLVEIKGVSDVKISQYVNKAKVQLTELMVNYAIEYEHIVSKNISFPEVINPIGNIRLKNPCAFLNSNGKCDIYEVRPIMCRKFGSLSDSQYAHNHMCILVDYKKVVDFSEFDINEESLFIFGNDINRPFPLCYWLGDILIFWNENRLISTEEMYKGDYCLK